MSPRLSYNAVPGKYVDIVKDVTYRTVSHVSADKPVCIRISSIFPDIQHVFSHIRLVSL